MLDSSFEMKTYLDVKEEIKHIDSLNMINPKERTERKILLNQIGAKLEMLYNFISNDVKLCLEISNSSKALRLQLNSELRWLQKTATLYFTEKFSRENKEILKIDFLSKIEGVQQGNRMLIVYLDQTGTQHQIIYYIKTHQHGSLRAGGSTIKLVDLKEMFVYKALEYAGFGPKTYFFFNPLSPSAFLVLSNLSLNFCSN